MKVKVFQKEDEDELSDAINSFLREHAHIRIYDIKFAFDVVEDEEELIYLFSAMLIYLDKNAT